MTNDNLKCPQCGKRRFSWQNDHHMKHDIDRDMAILRGICGHCLKWSVKIWKGSSVYQEEKRERTVEERFLETLLQRKREQERNAGVATIIKRFLIRRWKKWKQ